MKALVAAVIVLLVLALAMALTCPDEDSFRQYVEKITVPSDGNIIARLYTNLQHALSSDVRLAVGDDLDLFAATPR